MEQLIEHLQQSGYNPGSIIPDGKIHRFKHDDKDHKKSAFYIAYQNFSEKTGEKFHVICYGSWRGEETQTFCSLKEVSKEDKKLIKKKIAEMKKRESVSRLSEQKKVAVEVSMKWDLMDGTNRISAYLTKKQIVGLGSENKFLGVKLDAKGTVYIPARDCDGTIWSWQQIDWTGRKMFHPGGRIRGLFHTIGNPSQSDTIYVTEGFATAATIFMATKRFTVCTFFASNLTEVGMLLKKQYPDKSIVVCGDDDLWTTKADGTPHNPGRNVAEIAAEKCLGKAVFPEFVSLESKPTDFNDLHVLEGLEQVTKLIEGVKVEYRYLQAIGFREKHYFFTSSENQQIVAVSKFGKSDFLSLMPLEYWEATFPGVGASKVDWDEATSSLMQQARQKGIFESKNVRGAGVWSDDNRVVVNMGDHLIVDNRRTELGEIKSRYFYSLGIKMPELSCKPLSAKECEVITDACHLFRWKSPDFGYLLAGAMVTTRVCGALPIRPHTWLTGEKGSGKTTLFNRFIYPLIGEPLLFAAGNSTEAGVRQAVRADAVPVLFDEFENAGRKSQEKIQEVLDLMRLAWSDTNAAIIKGSSGGVSTAYSARFAALVTSIRQVSMTDADRSRFATLELGDHGSDPEHWAKLSGLLSQIDLNLGSRLFARTLGLLPVLLQNFKVMKRVLSKRCPSQRFSDQYGMLLAGYAILVQDEAMSVAQAEVLAGHVSLEDEKEEAKVSDQGDALESLMTCSTHVEFTASRKEVLIGDLIRKAWKNKGSNDNEVEALALLGIRVEAEFVAIVASNHTKLETSVFRGTRWSNSWANSFKRLPGAEKKKIRIAGTPKWTVRIPAAAFNMS